jgi:hypothetical protein
VGVNVANTPPMEPRKGHTHEAKPVTVSRSKQDSSLPTVLRWVT